MKKSIKAIFLAGGWLLTLAAFPVFAQEKPMRENKFNQKPLQDLSEFVRRETAAGKLDLTRPFSLEFEGVLNNANGRLDVQKSKFIKTDGDTVMVEIGKNFVEAVGDSGFLNHIKEFGVEKLNLTLVQDDRQISARVITELETPQKAASISSSLNAMVARAAQMKKDETRNLDEERILIGGLQASSDGKALIINLVYEKSVVQKLINGVLRTGK